MRPVVLAPLHVDDAYVVRVIDDYDGDVIHDAELRESLAEAIEQARQELQPYERVVGTLELEER